MTYKLISLRQIALLIVVLSAALAAWNIYAKPTDYSGIVAICRNDRLPAEEAVRACTQLIDSQEISESNRLFFLGKRAWAYKRAGDLENALSDNDQVLQMQPANIGAWVRRAYINSASGDYSAASEDFDKALELDPDRVSTIMRRANMLFGRGEFQSALSDYERILQYEPESYGATSKIAAIRIKREEYGRAIDVLNRATVIWPKTAFLQEALGRLYIHQRDYENALLSFASAAELEPGIAYELLLPGMAHIQFGNEDIGTDYVKRYAELFTQQALADKGALERMIIGFGQDVMLNDSTHFLFHGIALAAVGRPELARAEFDHYLSEGGAMASRHLRDLLASEGYVIDSSVGEGSDTLTTAQDKYITRLSISLTAEALGNQLLRAK